MEISLYTGNVLAVDDDQDLLALMRSSLKRKGFHVDISVNGEDLYQLIKMHYPDVILLDIQMDGVNGGDLCKKLKQDPATSHIPIIMLSANTNLAEVTKSCGADDYLPKPFNIDEMERHILKLVA
jgi:DNA-binding response OmpR family regulator